VLKEKQTKRAAQLDKLAKKKMTTIEELNNSKKENENKRFSEINSAITDFEGFEMNEKHAERERIGYRVEELRKAAGMTQGELAEKCSMSRATVNKIEAGKFSVGLDLIAKIARVLGGELDIVKKY